MGGSMMGGPGAMKDIGGQQSRFKWMMEGNSPAPSPPDTALHKNGMSTDGLKEDFIYLFVLHRKFTLWEKHTSPAALDLAITL